MRNDYSLQCNEQKPEILIKVSEQIINAQKYTHCLRCKLNYLGRVASYGNSKRTGQPKVSKLQLAILYTVFTMQINSNETTWDIIREYEYASSNFLKCLGTQFTVLVLVSINNFLANDEEKI